MVVLNHWFEQKAETKLIYHHLAGKLDSEIIDL